VNIKATTIIREVPIVYQRTQDGFNSNARRVSNFRLHQLTKNIPREGAAPLMGLVSITVSKCSHTSTNPQWVKHLYME